MSLEFSASQMGSDRYAQDYARKVSEAAKDRLKASGAWETEEDAEREVRRRTRSGVRVAA